MAAIIKNGQLTYVDENGTEYNLYPKTIIEQVEGLPEALNGKAPDGYGLGGLSPMLSSANLDDITANGWYSWSTDTINTPFYVGTMLVINRPDGNGKHYAFQIAFYDGTAVTVVKIRKRTDMVWGEWEWVNPPMELGVEYRTTKRYKGVAVYEKVDESGNILWRAENETAWHLLASAEYIAPATVE